MKAAPHLEIIKAADAKVAEYHSAAKGLAKDVTLQTARDALANATAAKEWAEVEDESVAPEDLVDRRTDAARDFEVAKIRVARAEKAQAINASQALAPLREATQLLSKALMEAVEPLRNRVEAGARRVFGDQMYDLAGPHFKGLVYQMGERCSEFSRTLNRMDVSNPDYAIQQIGLAKEFLIDCHRDR